MELIASLFPETGGLQKQFDSAQTYFQQQQIMVSGRDEVAMGLKGSGGKEIPFVRGESVQRFHFRAVRHLYDLSFWKELLLIYCVASFYQKQQQPRSSSSVLP